MLKNYFKIAVRQLLKNKLFSALNIFGFAISLAVCLLLITILNDQYSYDDFHENEDEIFRVTSSKREKTIPIQKPDAATTSLTIAEELADNYPFIKKAVRIAEMSGDFIYQDNNLGSPKGYAVDHDFLEMFSFGWVAGNKTTALQDPRSVVLTEEAAKKYFPNQEPIGEFVEINPFGKFQIKGILPTPPIRSHIRFDFLMSYATITAMTEIERQQVQIAGYENIWRGLVYLLLDEKNSQPQLDNALSQIAETYSTRDENYHYLFKSQALPQIMPTTNLGNDIGLGLPKMGIYFLIALGVIIMLAACFNYMNLSVAKSIKRAKEIGIRKVAGAEKKDIIIQFLGEAVLISFLSFLVAIILLEFMIPAFYSLDPFIEDVFHLSRSPKLYLIFLGFSLFIGLLAGIFPAFNISRYQPIQSIQKLSNVKIFSHVGLRKALITFQFALSLIFILTVIIVMQQQKKVLNADLGLRIDNLMNVSINDGVDYEIFAHKVKQLKGVKNVSASRDAILMGGASKMVTFHEETDSMKLAYNIVSQNYVNNMEIELIAGENFPENIHSRGEQFVLLNEKATKRMGYQSPDEAIGQAILIDTVPLTVIGVTSDFHHDNIYFGKLSPYGLRLGNDLALVNIRLNGTNTSETIQAVHGIWNEYSPKKSINAFFADEKVYHLSKFFRMGSSIIGFVGFLTILISCLGLLGMVIYTIEGRLKEIGIRKVLGAKEANLNWHLAKGFIGLLGIAIVISVPFILFISNLWLQNFLIRIDVNLGMILSGVGIILLLAAVTIFSQTHFASKTNPVNILRND